MNSDLFQREFAIEVEVSGAEPATSEKQFVFDGVRIFPLRYGIYNADNEDKLELVTNTSGAIEGQEEVEGYPCLFPQPVSVDEQPSIVKNNVVVASSTYVAIDRNTKFMPFSKGVKEPEPYKYKYYPYPLNEGYLYITSKLAKGVYQFEYTWNAGLVFKKFHTEENSSDKKANNGWCFYANIKDEVRLYFSPVLLPDSIVIEELYKKVHPHQKIINCKEWMYDGAGSSDLSNGILEDKDAWFVIPESNNCKQSMQTQKHVYGTMLANTLKDNNDPSNSSATRDVFVMLTDPFGVVMQVNEDLTNAHLAHESLIRSIRTGIDPQKIVSVLKSNTEGGYLSDDKLTEKLTLSKEHADNLDQIFYIHMLASGLYRAIYDRNHKFPKAEKAENNIDEDRLLKVLAVEERLQFHKKIEGKRNVLKEVLDSELFQNFVKFYNEIQEPSKKDEKIPFWDLLMEMKASIGAIYGNLAQRPFDKDNGLNLSTLYGDTSKYASNDPGLLAITALNNEENEAGIFINRKVNIEEYLDQDFGKKRPNLGTANAEININASLVSKYITTTHQVLTAITKVGFTPLEITFCKTINAELGQNIIPLSQQEVTNRLNKIAKQQGGLRYEAVSGSWKRKIEGNKGTVAIEIKRANISKLEKIAHAISTNPMFTLVIDLLAIKGASKINKSNAVRNTLDVAALVVVVKNTYSKYRQLALHTKPPFVQTGFKALKFTAATAGVYIGVAIDVTDGFESWSKSDYDAMACSIVSASAGLTSLGIAAFYAKAAWAGWAGLALATIAIGSKFLYTYCKDTPFEGFVKKTMFYDWFKISIVNEPYGFIRELATDDARLESLEAGFNEDHIYLDYKYLLEEFIYLHSFLFNFKPLLYFKKVLLPVYNGYNQLLYHRDVITEVMLNITSDFSLLSADIEEVIIESYFVKDSLDLGFGYQEKPYALFKSNEKSNFLFLSKNILNKINTNQELNYKEKQYVYEELKYNGIEQNELSSNKFHFFYHKKLGRVSYSQYVPPKFLGTEPIAPVHGDDNRYLILMVQMKTSDGQTIPFIHNKTKSERWLCYTYESKLDKGKTKAELKLKDSGIYTKNHFWNKTI